MLITVRRCMIDLDTLENPINREVAGVLRIPILRGFSALSRSRHAFRSNRLIRARDPEAADAGQHRYRAH
jgi:hypothetical protein